MSCYICVQLSRLKDLWNVWCEDRRWEWHFAMSQIRPSCLSSQRPLYGHIFQNNGIMVKSTIATKLMAILYRSHSTDGCVVTSIFTWGAACCRGHQQDVIYPFGAGFSNVTFHYLPCLVPSRCSDLFFFCFFSPAEIFNYLPSSDALLMPMSPFSRPWMGFSLFSLLWAAFNRLIWKFCLHLRYFLMCSHSFLQLTGLYPLQLA